MEYNQIIKLLHWYTTNKLKFHQWAVDSVAYNEEMPQLPGNILNLQHLTDIEKFSEYGLIERGENFQCTNCQHQQETCLY